MFEHRAVSGKHSRKILTTFLLSYMTVLLIPIGIGSIAYFTAGRALENEVGNSRMVMLKQACQAVDSRLKELQQLSMQISSDYTIREFLTVTPPLTETDRYKATHVIRELQPYKNSNHFIQDFYIYYKNSQLILNSQSMYTPSFFYNNIYSYSGMAYEDWYKTILNGNFYNHFLPGAEILSDKWPRNMITYLQSIPADEVRNPSALFAALIDEEMLKEKLRDIAADGSVYVADREHRIIVMIGESSVGFLPANQAFASGDGLLYERIGGRDMVISCTTSPQTGWKFVSIIPRSIFMSRVHHIRNITIFITGFCLLSGLLAAGFLAYKNYKPIRHLAETLSAWLGNMPLESTDELEYIRESIITALKKNLQLEQSQKELLKENRECRERIRANRPMVKNSLLLKLVKGKADDFLVITDWLAMYDITFPHPQFVVMLFHIDDCSRFVKSDSDSEWSLVRFVITSAAEELANEKYRGYMAELEYDSLALVMNFPDRVTSDRFKDEMAQMVDKVKYFVEKEFQTVLTIGVGEIHPGMEGIALSYGEAVKAMDYRIVSGSSSVIFCCEITDRDKDYYYPIDTELQLINYVKTGDYSQCESLLESLFQENFTNRRLPLKLIKCLFFDMMSTAIKTLDVIRINYTDIFGPEFDPVDRLTRCETIHQIQYEMKTIFNRICEYVNERKISHNIRLKEMVLKYIHEHYMEEGLSQTLVAEKMNITAPYLSKFFKQETGQNMVDYVNRLRIEGARYLLLNTSLPLHEIAHRTGCINDKALIRIFKQYEGVTPGRIRDTGR